MSRIAQLFAEKKEGILNMYCTAGYPQLNSTAAVMLSLQAHGADLLEIGMPYSDPLADGPVIQQSSARAIANGMTIGVLLQQLQSVQSSIHIPVVLMGYLNPILQFGFEKFCQEAKKAGVDGLIIPDLPMQAFDKEYRSLLEKYELDFIFLVTPETSEERIRALDRLSSGFLYAVSSSSITGGQNNWNQVEAYLRRLQQMQLKNPLLVGFGIKDRESFARACRYTQGAIIGTAYIQALTGSEDIDAATAQFLQKIREKNTEAV